MTEFLAGFPGLPALAIAGVVLFAESGLLIGVFLPGAGTVLALGWIAGQGALPVWSAALVASLATIAGCQHGFLRGAHPGALNRRLVDRVGEQRMQRVESALDGRAEPTAAISQCFAVVRTLVPRLAGRAGMSHPRFTACNAPVGAAWGTGLAVLGAFSGEAYARVQAAAGLFGLPLLALAAAVLALLWWTRRRRTSGTRTEPERVRR
ncbi:DedA family protein [Saccharopolyspora tripterygii]